MPKGDRLDWSLALGAVAIGVLLYLLDDRTNWSAGFGYDGRLYGELAKNFPSAVFGQGQVIPPGIDAYPGPPVIGLDTYYVFRIVPSGLVWLGLQVLGLAPTNGHVVGLFMGLNALMFGLATFCWCRSASLLGLEDRAKLLGAMALMLNFAVLKTGSYYPVLTDHMALGLGALSLYLWLRGSLFWLAACTLVACFTWPFHFVVGAVLLLFAPPENVRGTFAEKRVMEREEAEEDGAPWAGWRPAPFGIAVGAAVGAVSIAGLVLIQLSGRQSVLGTPQLEALFPLSAAVTGLFVFAVFAFFMPPSARLLWGVIRSIQPRRLLLAVGVIAAARIIGSLISKHSGYDPLPFLEEEFWWTTLQPGVFLVIFIGYFGPLTLALLADLPRAAANSWRLGPGMAAMVAAGLLGALTTQPREVVDALPFLLLPGVLAVRRLFGLSNFVLIAFFVVSLAFSRVWLPIDDMSSDLTQLLEFPAQQFYMALGPWTTTTTYAIQLGAVVLTALAGAAYLAWRRRLRPEGAQAGP